MMLRFDSWRVRAIRRDIRGPRLQRPTHQVAPRKARKAAGGSVVSSSASYRMAGDDRPQEILAFIKSMAGVDGIIPIRSGAGIKLLLVRLQISVKTASTASEDPKHLQTSASLFRKRKSLNLAPFLPQPAVARLPLSGTPDWTSCSNSNSTHGECATE